MSKEIYISSTPHETRLAIVEDDALTEIYYERENEYTLAGSIYNGKVTRVLPGMQSSFVDIGLDRDAFLYITDFMEETGDAADFEASANGGEVRRSPRDAGRSDHRHSERGARDSQPRESQSREIQSRSAEPTDSELFTEAVASLDPARPVSDSDRGDRSRRGGRNRRDRGERNSDGTSRRGERTDRPDRSDRTDRAERPAVRPEVRPEAPILAVPPAAEATADLGEGAPGADGSRRWRGRRGRRGNRPADTAQAHDAQVSSVTGPSVPGSSVPGSGVADHGAQALTPPADLKPTGPISNAYPPAYSDFDPDPYSEPSSTEADFDASAAAPGSRPERSLRGDRGDRNRSARAPQSARVPRGFAPSTSLYQVEGSAHSSSYGEDSPAPIEPTILPGESLSKYRLAGESPAQVAAPAAPVSLPSTEFTLVRGWDGGLVLPGETIRPRGPRSDSRLEDRPEGRPDSTRDFSPRGENRGPRPDRGGRERNRPDRPFREERTFHKESGTGLKAAAATPPQQRFAPVVPVSTPPAELASSPEPTYLTDPEIVPASYLVTPVNSTFVPPPPMPVEALAAEPVAAEPEVETPITTEQDYEPTEASASFRIDPVPPSEFRQSTLTLEPESISQPESVSPPESLGEMVHFTEAETLEALQEPTLSEHHLTSISASGDMRSEPFEPTTQKMVAQAPNSQELTAQELVAQELMTPDDESQALINQDLTAPAPSAQGSPQSSEPVAADIAAADQTIPAPYFAPGDGFLEEEELDDDEPAGHLQTLQAAAVHEAHDQETLEGVADLGSMIREMSIDQITRGEQAGSDDDDDLEEDFFEEDQDFDGDLPDSSDPDSDSSDSYASETERSSPYSADSDRPEDSEEQDEEFDSRHVQEGMSGHIGEQSAHELEESAYGSSSGPDSAAGSTERAASPDPRRDDRRRDGRRPDRSRRPSGDRDRGRRDGGHRQSAQSTNLPAISELLKPGQEILCQIAKEPIAKKGARITSHIALPGRFLVFMPTVHHTGVSRKIESDAERRRLKDILLSEKGEAAGGFIVRTAAAGASEEELRSDLRFLLNLWADIKSRSESSKSPALIYHDLNLVERVLRDQVTDTFSAIWVDSETEYERVLRFLQRFQPSLIRRVKLYTKETPLFEQFGITEEINKALRSKVWLKSGGSIVINQTEALVAIDINTGKFVGKTARLEDTIVKTNLDAIPEIVRQIRLRDLGGIIIIDFIDMDDRKNRNKVMAALEDELKTDRAPSKVLPFNDFGLVAITRKRVKQSLERTLSATCAVCQGTGMTKSPVTVCNDIYVEMRKMQKHLDRGDVMLRVHPEVVKQLKSTTSRWLQEMEEMVGKTILVKSDPSLHPEQFDIH